MSPELPKINRRDFLTNFLTGAAETVTANIIDATQDPKTVDTAPLYLASLTTLLLNVYNPFASRRKYDRFLVIKSGLYTGLAFSVLDDLPVQDDSQ